MTIRTLRPRRRPRHVPFQRASLPDAGTPGSPAARTPRVLYVVTHPMTARVFLRGQLSWMRDAGCVVAVAAAPGPDLDAVAEREGVEVFPVPIAREISLPNDVAGLAALYRLFREFRPDIVVSATPKAGLLGSVAAWAARVPVRVYYVLGLRLETVRGAKRGVLWATERVASLCAHRVRSVSPSLAVRYVSLGLAKADKVSTPTYYSPNGIDPTRFRPREAEAQRLREGLGLGPDVPVVGFVGRLTRDKGVADLVSVFERVRARVPEARLLLVGDFEEGDPVPDGVRELIRSREDIVATGFVGDPAPYYSVMDVLAFPSHREGLGMVPLEAAAAERPTVGYDVVGVVDGVQDGVTGVLVPLGATGPFADAVVRYLTDRTLRTEHGRAGRAWVEDAFAPEKVSSGLLDELRTLLAERSLAPFPNLRSA